MFAQSLNYGIATISQSPIEMIAQSGFFNAGYAADLFASKIARHGELYDTRQTHFYRTAMKTTAHKAKSRYELWQETINRSLTDERWNEYDCDIKSVVREFNQHLSGQGGYRALDWHLIKAMIWTESGGPDNRAWKRNPMQIGNPGDPGLRALLSVAEGGNLILPKSMARGMSETSVRATSLMNIRAGTGYLLMRLAHFEIGTEVAATGDVQTIEVHQGDTLSRLARTNGTTVNTLKSMNGGMILLRPGTVLKYQKARMRKAIVGWDAVTTTRVASRYNVGDPAYARKLNHCLALIKKLSEGAPCAA